MLFGPRFLLILLLLLATTGQQSLGQKAVRQTDPLNGNGNGNGINDGHRLITRALWRIFDALMEKKNHDDLYGRMKFVEGALNDMISSDSKMENKIENVLQTSVTDHKEKMSYLTKEVEKIKSLEARVREIEEWQLRLERPRDDDTVSPSLGDFAKPGFSACPTPFVAVGGECIHVFTEKKLGWRDARRECARTGGDLASPRDLAALRNHLKSLLSVERPEYAWIGGSKTFDDKWVWATGSQAGIPIDMSQETWNDELPEGAGDCMGLYERAGYRAYDYACQEKDHFICQYFF